VALTALAKVDPKASTVDASVDGAFVALRTLSDLLAALTSLQETGAFGQIRRTPEVLYVVGQRVMHAQLGQCVIYGWDHSCRAAGGKASLRLAAEDDALGLIDNRLAFDSVDSSCDASQPFYRVQTLGGEQPATNFYAAQEMLQPVPRPEHMSPSASTFYFTRDDAASGCLMPRPELAQRYPDDVQLIARTWFAEWAVPQAGKAMQWRS